MGEKTLFKKGGNHQPDTVFIRVQENKDHYVAEVPLLLL